MKRREGSSKDEGAIGALMNRVLQPRLLVVLGLNVGVAAPANWSHWIAGRPLLIASSKHVGYELAHTRHVRIEEIHVPIWSVRERARV